MKNAISVTPKCVRFVAGFAVLCGLCLLTYSGTQAQEGSTADDLRPDLPYQAKKSEPVTYDVDFSVVVTPPYRCKKLKVWLPVPQTDAGQEVTSKEITSFPMDVKPAIGIEAIYGNKFAYFEYDHPEGAQIIRHKFTVKVWQLDWDVSATRVKKVDSWPAAFQPYLRAEEQSVVIDDRIRRLAADLKPTTPDGNGDLAAVMDWINTNLKYDHDSASLQASAVHALEMRRGHCSDYHGLCAALGRALGHPTRVTYGINPFPKNSPSHCKVEAFLPPYGWVSFDVSETQKLMDAIQKSSELDQPAKQRLILAAKDRLTRGFRDNTWFLQTKGTDYDLVPKASKRVTVVRTAYVEADGVSLAEPDPANKAKREFTWMTIHKYSPDRQVKYPFTDWSSLRVK